jgi:hypothetical protein
MAGCRAESDTASSTASEGHADARRLVCPIVPFPSEADGTMLRWVIDGRCSECEPKGDRIDADCVVLASCEGSVLCGLTRAGKGIASARHLNECSPRATLSAKKGWIDAQGLQ